MSTTQSSDQQKPELLVVGIHTGEGREEIILDYLKAAGYNATLGRYEEISENRPLGIVLDISPHADDGWGELLRIKCNPETRTIPVLPVFLSQTGKVGGVFPVAGFFTTPVDIQHILDRLATYGLTEEAETWDLQALVVSRTGEENLHKALESIGFEVVNGYTGKEALALTSMHPKYLAISSLMLPDMSAFELLEKLSLFPYSHNMPVFVLIKDQMKDGEKQALSREIAHLVSKRQLSKEEFIKYLRNRN